MYRVFYIAFLNIIYGENFGTSLRMAAIAKVLLHMKPTLAWEMYDPCLSCNSTYPILLKSFKMPTSCNVAGLTFDNFPAHRGSSYLEILVSSLQMLPFIFCKELGLFT
jgi:hypothetical protein